MDYFMFSWQDQDLTRSLRSLVKYCSYTSNKKSTTYRDVQIQYESDRIRSSKSFRIGLEKLFGSPSCKMPYSGAHVGRISTKPSP